MLDTLTVVIAFAMGVQAMAARRVGVGDVTTVVVTSTLAGLMGENRVTGRSAGGLTIRRALAVVTMALGAVTGAFLMLVSVEVAVGASGLLTLAAAGLLTVRGIVLRSQQAEGTRPRSSPLVAQAGSPAAPAVTSG